MKTSDNKTQKAATENGSFVKRMIDSHSILGLTFAALIYVVSLSGALTLFIEEIHIWEAPIAEASQSASSKAIGAATQNAAARLQPGNEILNIITIAPDEFRPFLTTRLNEWPERGAELTSTDWIADPETGALIESAETPFAHIVEMLHTDLLLPRPWGRYLVGLIGVAMFTLILSGIFAHPTIVKDAFKLRLRRNARMAWTDIHNRLSVWGLPFHLVLTFTGAFLGIAGITVAALAMLVYQGDQEAAIQVIQGPQAILERPLMTEAPDYEAMLNQSEADDRTFSLLIANNPNHSGYTTTIAYHESGILSAGGSDIYRNDGEFLQKIGGRGSPAGNRVFGMVQPLHYGTFGGYPIKFFYLILALALTYITSTGMMIWFKRKRQQGLEKIKTEAAWRGMTTGLSLGLSATALLGVLSVHWDLLPVFLAIWLGSAVSLFFASRLLRWVAIQYYVISALIMAALIVRIPAVLSSPPATTPILIGASVALGFTALGFLIAGLRLRSNSEIAPIKSDGLQQA